MPESEFNQTFLDDRCQNSNLNFLERNKLILRLTLLATYQWRNLLRNVSLFKLGDSPATAFEYAREGRAGATRKWSAKKFPSYTESSLHSKSKQEV